MPTPHPESLLPWDPNFTPPSLDTNLLSQVTNDVTAAANALNQGVGAITGQATQIGSEVVGDAATAATTAAAEAAAAAAGAVQAAGAVVSAVVPQPPPAPTAPAAPTSVTPDWPVLPTAPTGDLVSVIEQAALAAAKSASSSVLPGIEKAIEAKVAATVQTEATNVLKRLEGGAEEPPVPNLDDFIHADGRSAAFRTLLIGVVLSALWGLVNVLGNLATVDWHNRDALPQVVSIAATGIFGAVVAYVGRIAKPPAHIANAVIVPGTKS